MFLVAQEHKMTQRVYEKKVLGIRRRRRRRRTTVLYKSLYIYKIYKNEFYPHTIGFATGLQSILKSWQDKNWTFYII